VVRQKGELGVVTLSELASVFKMSVPGMGYAAERGEKLVRSDILNWLFKNVPFTTYKIASEL